MLQGAYVMNTTEEVEFDYQTYMNEISLDSVKIHRGTEAREKRRRTAMRALASSHSGSAHPDPEVSH